MSRTGFGLRKAVVAFFRHDVKLARGRGGLELVFEDRRSERASAAPADARGRAALREHEALEAARHELKALLDAEPTQRAHSRQLARIEQALARYGWQAFDKAPLGLLHAALEELEGLVTNWSGVGLATLRSKLAVAAREREAERADPTSRRSAHDSLHGPRSVAQQAIADAKAEAIDDSDIPPGPPQTGDVKEGLGLEQAALLAAYASASMGLDETPEPKTAG